MDFTFFKTKSQGLSITTIIVAAIALIVLVVLIAIFTGRLGGFGKGLDAVQNRYCEESSYDALSADEKERSSTVGGIAVRESAGCNNADRVYGNFKDLDSNQICCK